MSKLFRPKGVRALRFVRVSNYRLGRRLHRKGGICLRFEGAEMPEPIARDISLKPPADPAMRRYSRVIAMVSELHKAGYQRIRLFPALSPSGGFMRAEITFADNTNADCSPINDAWVVRYSTGDGSAFFGWPDATDMSARQLAAVFVERYPEIARQGQGRDWAYAGWLSEILGQAEAGDPIILWADDDFLSDDHLALWKPPAVISEAPAFPAIHTHIANEALTLEIIPESTFGWDRLEPFCTYYDGYDRDRRTIAECGEIAKCVIADVENASMDDLRIALFFQQRKIRWNDHMPLQKEDVDEIRPVIAEIRRRFETQSVNAPRLERLREEYKNAPVNHHYQREIMARHEAAATRLLAEQAGLLAAPNGAASSIIGEAADFFWACLMAKGQALETREVRNDAIKALSDALERHGLRIP